MLSVASLISLWRARVFLEVEVDVFGNVNNLGRGRGRVRADAKFRRKFTLDAFSTFLHTHSPQLSRQVKFNWKNSETTHDE